MAEKLLGVTICKAKVEQELPLGLYIVEERVRLNFGTNMPKENIETTKLSFRNPKLRLHCLQKAEYKGQFINDTI